MPNVDSEVVVGVGRPEVEPANAMVRGRQSHSHIKWIVWWRLWSWGVQTPSGGNEGRVDGIKVELWCGLQLRFTPKMATTHMYRGRVCGPPPQQDAPAFWGKERIRFLQIRQRHGGRGSSRVVGPLLGSLSAACTRAVSLINKCVAESVRSLLVSTMGIERGVRRGSVVWV